ncbi:MAG: hydrogenase maturation protease, partial [Pseudomonadota bacterium]
MAKKYIIGLGNYSMADDAVGLRVVEAIAQAGLAKEFEVENLSDNGIRLLDFFTPQTEKILLVDAVVSGRNPGEYFFFDARDAQSAKVLSRRTTHEGDILSVLRLGVEMGLPIPPITVMGIEPERMEQGITLSPTLGS